MQNKESRAEALTSLIFDSLESLRESIKTIELRDKESGIICAIVFFNDFALQEYKKDEARILERMRTLYKERNLKEIVTFNSVLAEAYKPKKPSSKAFYKERATGNFEILTNEPRLRAGFLEIQEIIKSRIGL